MSTRGVFGIRNNGIRAVSMIYTDAHPGGVGLDNLNSTKNELIDHSLNSLKRNAKFVNPVYAKDQIGRSNAAYINRTLEQEASPEDTWGDHLTLRPPVISDLFKMQYYISADEFAKDSLFCEWGYVLNLDTEEFQVYRGFVTGEHNAGIWGGVKPVRLDRAQLYYPIALVASWPTAKLPSTDEFLSALEEEEE